jgi:hypothetical protein
MPVSRPILIVLVAAVVALAGFYATQGSRDSADTAAPVVPAEPVPTAQKDSDRPQAVAAKPDAATEQSADAKSKPSAAAARKAASAKVAARRRAREERIGMPLAVARALRNRQTVVLYFRGSPSADDRSAARSVAGLRGQRGVAVFADRIGRLGRYRAVVGELGIAQAPAVVIVGRGRSARVVEGYIDPTTLAQDVADAR